MKNVILILILISMRTNDYDLAVSNACCCAEWGLKDFILLSMD